MARQPAGRKKSLVRKGDAENDELNEFGRPIDPRYNLYDISL